MCFSIVFLLLITYDFILNVLVCWWESSPIIELQIKNKQTHLYADTWNILAFYETLRSVYGSTHQVQALLNSLDDNMLLTNK